MKIRLISDLHLDINSGYSFDFKAENLDDVFTVIAGDISGSPEQSAKWLEENVSRGAFISGNHDVYDTDMPIEDIKKFFSSRFPASADVTYFDNDIGVISKEIGDNVLLVADVMYTDYTFPVPLRNPNGSVEKNMYLADSWRNGRYGMNDFNYGKCRRRWAGTNDKTSAKYGRLVPEYYLEHNRSAFEAINEVVENNANREIMLVTHHCLSPKCIDSEHEDSSVIASYVSDREDWIIAHPNVKCVCSGHIHARKNFNVGGALYVMNPLGYCRDHYMQWSDEAHSYIPWTPNCIIDTSSWTVDFMPYDMHGWKSKYDHDIEKMKNILPFFM